MVFQLENEGIHFLDLGDLHDVVENKWNLFKETLKFLQHLAALFGEGEPRVSSF